VPATVPKGQKIQPDPGKWDGDTLTGWRCLGFSVESPVYYQYGYTAVNPADPTTASFTATATGDLDGNGTAGDPWLYAGGIVTGTNNVTAMRLAPTIHESTNPEE
jgi:hypothetical protein